MKVEVLGDGDPEVAVVGLVHGDEICGLRAIERFKHQVQESEFEIQKPVKLVLANEKAFRKGERYIDTDLNRSFPGDPESEHHEERLAAELQEELEGLKVLDLHSSESPNTPFAIVSGLDLASLEVAKSTCMEKVVEISYVQGGLIDGLEAAVVECGFHNSKESAKVAYDVMMNFLAAEGVVEKEYDRSEPAVFQVYDEAEGSGYEFTAENFESVQEGETFAENGDEEKVADEKFYPVLMSSDGYEDMIGFKSKRFIEE